MKKILSLTAIVIMVSSSAYAGLVETFGIGVRETSMGKAVSAKADTPFAAYYNPAGLTLIERPTISVGAMVYDAQVYSDNFRLVATESGKGSYADIKKGDIINEGWNTDNETDNDPLVNPHIGFALPINDKISFGIAAYAPYGFNIESDRNGYKNPLSFYAWESFYARKVVTPTIAYKLSDKLSFGFGISLGNSVSDAGKTYRYNPFAMQTAADPASQAALAKAIGDITAAVPGGSDGSDAMIITGEVAKGAVLISDSKNGKRNELKLESEDEFNASWNAGVMYKPSEKLSLGLTYRSRSNGDFEGDIFMFGTKIGSVAMNYDHPEQFQGGIRYAFSDNFALEFDLTWTRWSINENQVEKMTLDELGNISKELMGYVVSSINANTRLSAGEKAALIKGLASSASGEIPTSYLDAGHNREWEDKIQYQLGAEWIVNDKLALRSGIIYDPTPVPDSTFDYGWPDTDRTVVNLGCGYKITKDWEVDMVFQHVFSTPKREIKGDSEELNHVYNDTVLINPDAPHVGVYLDNDEGVLWGAGMTVTYKF